MAKLFLIGKKVVNNYSLRTCNVQLYNGWMSNDGSNFIIYEQYTVLEMLTLLVHLKISQVDC